MKMAALTMDMNTAERAGDYIVLPVAAQTTIFGGAIVAMNAEGYAVPGKTAIGLKALGCAEERATNVSEAKAVSVKVKHGIFLLDNSDAADEISKKDIGADCYMVDDHTVALTDGAAKRSKAGKIFDVDDQGVWVEI